ncbi:nuclear cap-binding protein subunit 1 isoform 1 [Camelus ferus]|nr:nuclear cap-binding protein subunit 1 isoform 1 [Camelus ferus]
MVKRAIKTNTQVGLLNARNYNFGGEFVEAMIRQLKESLKANNYSEAVYLVRFLSDLVNCHVIAAPSMVAMFENFVSVTQEEDVPQVRRDWYVYTFLSSLPWVGKELYEKKDAEMDRIFANTESYLNILCEALQHNLPPFTPPPHTEDSMYPMPRVIFRMFDYTDDPEVIFAELFQLPAPPHIDVMYTTLLIELCKLQPGSLPQVAHGPTGPHLSANQLSYHQRILDIVPPTFSALCPANPTCIYKYGDESSNSLPGHSVALCLAVAFKSKATNDEIFSILKDVPNPNQDDDDDEGFSFNPLKIEVFVQTLLHLAAKSFSHSFSALAKFHEVFKTLAESDEGKLHVLRVMFEVWRNHPQMIAVLVDKMIRTQIVDCAAVANWIFSSELSRDFTRLFVWEILHSTIRKMNKHVLKIQKELEEAKEKLARQHKRRSDDDDRSSDRKDGALEEQIERLQEKVESAQSEQKNLFLVIFQHHQIIQQYMVTLENLLFTAELDPHILAVFQQFCALQA